MTREILDKLPTNVLNHIEELKKDYNFHKMDFAPRIALREYVKGLRDAGLITEQERKVLFIYTTI